MVWGFRPIEFYNVQPASSSVGTSTSGNGTTMKTALRLTVAAFVLTGFSMSGESTIQLSALLYTVLENAGVATITVRRANDVNTVVTLDYASTTTTATPGLDYTDVA